MNRPDVSVVVPVRNAAPYLERCLASLVAQTERAIEVVVVDDGSTDGTAGVAEAFCALAPGRFRLLRQAASGQATARNRGIRAARGRWIGTVDGDDWAEPDMFAALRRRAESTGADLVLTRGRMVEHLSGDSKPFHDRSVWDALGRHPGWPVFDPRSVPDLFLLDASACLRLYRAELLDRHAPVFLEGLLFDDVAAHFRLLLAAGRVALLDEELYCYRVGHPGRVTDRTDAALLQIFEILGAVVEALESAAAGREIWVRFVAFQSWVVRWLGGQIEPELALPFSRSAQALARRFPRDAVETLLASEGTDPGLARLLAVQCSDRARLLVRVLRGTLGPRAAGRLDALLSTRGASASDRS